ncbi:MAG TPA: hydrogenase expression/formation protein HypE [Thermoanaerobaculia bacterium]|nr:hydrogenase expression/formation protein HypE [Thermoanaerobaculia bacterium]
MSGKPTLAEAMARIERSGGRRRGAAVLREERVTLSHGSGGKASRALVESVFAAELSNPLLDPLDDCAVLPAAATGSRLVFTTDSYVVKPLFFPGGNIGRLAVHGTVNDLAMAGATPLYLSLGVILEEGFPIVDLRRIVASIRHAADEAGVSVVTGDTKVVERGKADGVYLNTAGVGELRPGISLAMDAARPGDRVLVSGTLGDHGVAILVARAELELESTITSDSAPLHGLAAALVAATGPGLRALKDPTRGGLATALNEIASASDVGVAVDEAALPIAAEVRGACEIVGIDPLHLANEGKLVAIVAPEVASAALAALRAHPLGRNAAIIGEAVADPVGMVYLRTAIGGHRVLDMLAGDALPRIC